jgi:mediator of RNA polymerase II transcription subunit 17
LQQNWKVKRQRLGGNEVLTFDLFDGSSLSAPDSTVMTRPLQMSTISIDRDTSGMLAIHLPERSCRTLSLRFLGDDDSPTCRIKSSTSEKKASSSGSGVGRQSMRKESLGDEKDVDSCIEATHSILRDIHRSLFEEKVLTCLLTNYLLQFSFLCF